MLLEFPKPGDLIQFQKACYTHWAVLVKDKYIIHVQAPDRGKKGQVIIAKIKLDDYLKNELIKVLTCKLNLKVQVVEASVNNNFDKLKKPFHVDKIIRRAEDMVGKNWNYNLFRHNCEHFAHWCRYGVKVCRQSPNYMKYDDEYGNKCLCAQVGGTNVGPVDFKILGFNADCKKVFDRRRAHANAELISVGFTNLWRVSVGVEGEVGDYGDGDGIGFKAETKYVEVNYRLGNAKLGLGVSTGIDIKNGFKAELLGTGFGATSEGYEVKVLGSSVAAKWPWKWFESFDECS